MLGERELSSLGGREGDSVMHRWRLHYCGCLVQLQMERGGSRSVVSYEELVRNLGGGRGGKEEEFG